MSSIFGRLKLLLYAKDLVVKFCDIDYSLFLKANVWKISEYFWHQNNKLVKIGEQIVSSFVFAYTKMPKPK
jgi:hypothetical protein